MLVFPRRSFSPEEPALSGVEGILRAPTQLRAKCIAVTRKMLRELSMTPRTGKRNVRSYTEALVRSLGRTLGAGGISEALHLGVDLFAQVGPDILVHFQEDFDHVRIKLPSRPKFDLIPGRR
jgi:hypothetical protein